MAGLLKGQNSVVTGGTAGIGKAIAIKFAREGANVAVFGTNKTRGEEVVSELSKIAPEGNFHFFKVDVSQASEVEANVGKVLDLFTAVDVLVNNAGITRDKLLIKMSDEEWDQVMDVNTKSCFLMCRALTFSMMRAKKGKVINMSSVIGLTGNAGQVNYASSKAAIIGFTKALAKELAARNVCVNCIAPGYIETAMTDSMTDAKKEETLRDVPLGRMGLPEEVADAALFLASPMANYITGQVLTVDGGLAV